eukprot:scaffold241_cov242-Pinguiococcus_pyrenoidosus.AAC.37
MSRRSRGKRLAQLAGAAVPDQADRAASSSPSPSCAEVQESKTSEAKGQATPDQLGTRPPLEQGSDRKKRQKRTASLADDGCGVDSSQTPKGQGQAHPEDDVLVSLFTSLGAALILFRRRRRTPFFPRLQQAVASSGARRRLRIEHVAQMLTVYPGAFAVTVRTMVAEQGDANGPAEASKRNEYVVGLPQNLTEARAALQKYLPSGTPAALGAVMDARVKRFVDLLSNTLASSSWPDSSRIPGAVLPDLRVRNEQRAKQHAMGKERLGLAVAPGDGGGGEERHLLGIDGVLERVRAREKRKLAHLIANSHGSLEQRRFARLFPALADGIRSWCLQHQRRAARLEELAVELAKTCVQASSHADPETCSWEGQQQTGSKGKVIRALRAMSELVPGWMSFSPEGRSPTNTCVRFDFSFDFGVVKDRLRCVEGMPCSTKLFTEEGNQTNP